MRYILMFLLTACTTTDGGMPVIEQPYPPEPPPLESTKHTGGIIKLAKGKEAMAVTQAKVIKQARFNCQSDIKVVSKKWVGNTFYLNYDCR